MVTTFSLLYVECLNVFIPFYRRTTETALSVLLVSKSRAVFPNVLFSVK